MYMGVILSVTVTLVGRLGAPHVYGGDPGYKGAHANLQVLPMYMGVIPLLWLNG